MVLKVELTHTEGTAMSWIGMVGSPLEVLANGSVVMNGSPLAFKTAALTARFTSYVGWKTFVLYRRFICNSSYMWGKLYISSYNTSTFVFVEKI